MDDLLYFQDDAGNQIGLMMLDPVSYTHLTLPTTTSV